MVSTWPSTGTVGRREPYPDIGVSRTPPIVLRRTPRVRLLSGFLVALGLAVGALVVAAPPADAHGIGGLQPTNYRSSILDVDPEIPGVSVRTVDLGSRVELSNTTDTEVTVLGYDGEPYLRVGPHGVFENHNSPATYLNQTVSAGTVVPAHARAGAKPDWHRISGESVVTWHDHRTHWMGRADPPIVTRQPDREHRIQDWTIRLLWGTTPVAVHGEVRWIPGPSLWPWLLLALGLALLVGGLCLLPAWRWVTGVGLVVLVAAEAAHVVGLWGATTDSVPGRLVAVIYSLGAIIIALIALVRLVRRAPWDAAPVVLIAGIFLLVSGGLVGLTALTRSQIPTTLSPALARLSVALSLGIGAGLVFGAARHLRPPEELRRRRRRRVPTAVP